MRITMRITTLPQIPENHPNHEWTVFSIFMLRTDRTSGHYHFDEYGFFTSATCPRSEVRATAEAP